jgi:hypothetical protein
MNHKIVTNHSDKPPLGPELELGPEIDAMELREFEIISTENKDAVIEFETGVIDWDSGPRGTFRFAIDLTSLGVLGRQCSEASVFGRKLRHRGSQARKDPPRRPARTQFEARALTR